MAASIGAPRQHSQTSRKGKRAWRKNVDVSDIQIGLDNVREEIIKGGIIAEKASDELFTVDTGGSEQIQKTYNKVHKSLKADEILAQRSAIPAVDNRKRPGFTDGVLEPNGKRRKGNGVNHKQFERLTAIAYGGEAVPKDVVKADGAPGHDPWAVNGDETTPDSRFNYLEKPKPIRAPTTLKEAPVSLVEGGTKFPAVPRPQGGKSYNPRFEDWDKLLVEEGEKEVEAELKRIKEADEEQTRLDKIAAAQDERDDIQTEDESAWEGFESEYEGEEWLKKRRPERKTPAERNKIKRRKEAERQAKQEAEMKKRAQQAQRIKEIAQQVKIKSEAKASNLVKIDDALAEVGEDAALRRRKFGRSSIPERPLELVLTDELQDSLRLLKPEGNLVTDRFRNILLRGKVESRRQIHQPKKARRTVTEKWTSKDFAIST